MDLTIRRLTAQDNTQLQSIGEALCFLKKDYPDFLGWYRKKVLPGLATASRQVYIAVPGDCPGRLAGVMILKDTPAQKKICTLYVAELYRGQKLGSKFLSRAISVLRVHRPLITVSDAHQSEFSPLFRHFGFQLYDSCLGYYRKGVSEHSYNGPIEPVYMGKAVNL